MKSKASVRFKENPTHLHVGKYSLWGQVTEQVGCHAWCPTTCQGFIHCHLEQCLCCCPHDQVGAKWMLTFMPSEPTWATSPPVSCCNQDTSWPVTQPKSGYCVVEGCIDVVRVQSPYPRLYVGGFCHEHKHTNCAEWDSIIKSHAPLSLISQACCHLIRVHCDLCIEALPNTWIVALANVFAVLVSFPVSSVSGQLIGCH